MLKRFRMGAMLKRLTDSVWDYDMVRPCQSGWRPHGAPGLREPHAFHLQPLPFPCVSPHSALSPRSLTTLRGGNELRLCLRKSENSVTSRDPPLLPGHLHRIA